MFQMNLYKKIFGVLFIVCLFCFSLSLLMLFYDYSLILEWNLKEINSFMFNPMILVDGLSLMFIFVVFFISSCVTLYSMTYMNDSVNMNRFIMLVFGFVMSMMILVLSGNMFMLILGWDGLGLVSYCLVIFYQNFKSNSAGLLTIFSNRIGDVFLILMICLSLSNLDLSYIFMNKSFVNLDYMIVLFVMLAACTKSAQLPFSAWLPAAMAAPTPVSSLVHSSTLVTAGVYLMIRLNGVVEYTGVNRVLEFLSLLTLIMSGLAANYECDLKKIIAFSTLSQLSLMMFSVSLGYPLMAYFHMLTHAFFKALLFMCAGVIIHSVGSNQDIRLMGGFLNSLPLTFGLFIMANMALCGFPFLAGFYSKDLIIEMYLMNSISLMEMIIFVLSTILTVSYTLRLLYKVTMKKINFWSMQGMYEDKKMAVSTMLMGLISVGVGSMLSWLLNLQEFVVFMSMIGKMFILSFIFVGLLLMKLLNFTNYYYKFFLVNLWFMNKMLLNGWMMNTMKTISKNMDMGWNELIGGWGVYKINNYMFNFLITIQTNMMKIYLLVILLFIVTCLF
uniref:NADH dehydrogenase subunit 5 n=1 Tax=Lynceus grossipedia TaxID=2774322 RepID=UPI0023AAD294|nr:NADH dehydrogenase subunit 5 [Lynceus grossipedia]WCD23725.1 NADH dehydrogenase subunit 5 [Lynceus grossipedia]